MLKASESASISQLLSDLLPTTAVLEIAMAQPAMEQRTPPPGRKHSVSAQAFVSA